jgi:hypothetical protein
MKFQGAQIREQGKSFAIVVVKPQAVTTLNSRQEAIVAFQPYFPGLPVVLASRIAAAASRITGRQILRTS